MQLSSLNRSLKIQNRNHIYLIVFGRWSKHDVDRSFDFCLKQLDPWGWHVADGQRSDNGFLSLDHEETQKGYAEDLKNRLDGYQQKVKAGFLGPWKWTAPGDSRIVVLYICVSCRFMGFSLSSGDVFARPLEDEDVGGAVGRLLWESPLASGVWVEGMERIGVRADRQGPRGRASGQTDVWNDVNTFTPDSEYVKTSKEHWLHRVLVVKGFRQLSETYMGIVKVQRRIAGP